MKDAYRLIQQRVAAAETETPSPLRQALTELFINHPAIAPHDQCAPATAKMTRYKVANGASLGHEMDLAPQHLWLAAGRLPPAFEGLVRHYAPDEGRHSNTNPMPDMREKAVVRLTVTDIGQAEAFLNALLAQ